MDIKPEWIEAAAMGMASLQDGVDGSAECTWSRMDQYSQETYRMEVGAALDASAPLIAADARAAEINRLHAYAIPKNDLDGKERLRQIIKEKSLMRGEEFTLTSGQTSGYFFNMKKTMMDPEGANLIAEEILKLLESEGPVSVGGLEMGAVPILSVLCAKSYYTRQQIPAFFVRKMKKGHGTNQLIDGNLQPGSNVVLVDDVTTTGGSVRKAVEAVRAQNCTITRIITVVDREEGAVDNLAKFDITLVPIFTRADFEQ